jgi:hypothetical protein
VLSPLVLVCISIAVFMALLYRISMYLRPYHGYVNLNDATSKFEYGILSVFGLMAIRVYIYTLQKCHQRKSVRDSASFKNAILSSIYDYQKKYGFRKLDWCVCLSFCICISICISGWAPCSYILLPLWWLLLESFFFKKII